MRNGILTLRLRSATGGDMVETSEGYVLARPGQVYTIELTNNSPRRIVARVTIDGRNVTGRGVVIPAYCTTELERPIVDGEHGRFTVCAEGDEDAFGPDGGRDNPLLGVVEVEAQEEISPPQFILRSPPLIPSSDANPWSTRPWLPPYNYPAQQGRVYSTSSSSGILRSLSASTVSFGSNDQSGSTTQGARQIEKAAGTGLTGRSSQQFREVSVGVLCPTIIRAVLRIVIGSVSAPAVVRPLPGEGAPARPSPQP